MTAAKLLGDARRWVERVGPLRLFRIFLAGLGAVLLCLAFHRCVLLLDLRRWEAVEGTVLASRIASETVTDGRHRGTVYVPAVQYEYRVAGKRLRGDRIAVDDLRNGHVTKVAPVVKRYPKGGAVTVHYDPEEPGDALLEMPGAAIPLGATLGGLLLLGLAAWKRGAGAVGRVLLELFG